MDNVSQALMVVTILLLAVGIGILNDWTKARAYRKALEEEQEPTAGLENHKTDWRLVVLFVIFGVLFVGVAIFLPGYETSRWVKRILALVAVGIIIVGGILWRFWKK